MDSQSKLFVVILIVVSLLALAILFEPVVEEQLAPELVTAWVGIEVADSGLAEVGPVTLEAGVPFSLVAVLEAEGRGGRKVYYTEASRLSFGGEEVPADRLERWTRRRPVKVHWFTLEGERPYVELDAERGIAGFIMRELLRSDWPSAWTIPGEIDAANDNHLEVGSALPAQLFGTQRYHVRVELYNNEDSVVAAQVVRSWGVDDLKREIDRFPTASVLVPGAAGPASRVFGLSQLALPPAADAALLGQVDELARHHIAHTGLTVLRDQIAGAGKSLADLEWQLVDFSGTTPWGTTAAAGDLLRVGDRMVVLYEDRGTPGVLDYGDLCFDFVRGAAVRALEDVFTGGGTDVELASLAGPATDPGESRP